MRSFIPFLLAVGVLASAALTTVQAQEPSRENVVWISWSDRNDSATLAREVQKIGRGDRVLVYVHGGGRANLDDLLNSDLRFLEQLRAATDYDALVVFDFLDSLSFKVLGPVPGEARLFRDILRQVSERAGVLPDALCYSAGAALCRTALRQGAEFDTLVLLDLNVSIVGNRELSEAEQAGVRRGYNIFARRSPDEPLASAYLHGGFIRGMDNVDIGEIPHTELTDPGSAALNFVTTALRGELSANVEAPDDRLPMELPTRRCPPFCPPFPPGPGGGGVGLASPLLLGERSSLPSELGGIDFSSVHLTYVAEFPEEGFRYAFRAMKAADGDTAIQVNSAAELSADAFFIWLALPPDTFWVNLHPEERDRIIDERLGETDVGRILLEGDLRLKKDQASLMHPDTDLGRRFWDDLDTCAGESRAGEDEGDLKLNFRSWIVPGDVRVWADESQIFVVNADLDVKLETKLAQISSDESSAGDSEFEACSEQLLRELVIPQVARLVNEAPQYEQLRQVYIARVVSEWYKSRGGIQEGLFGEYVGRGDVTEFRSREVWSKDEIFERYLQSIREGEFDVTRVEDGRERHYFAGGVDFTNVPMVRLAYEDVLSEVADLEEVIPDAVLLGTREREDEYWAGGLILPAAVREDADQLPPSSGQPEGRIAAPDDGGLGWSPWLPGGVGFLLGAATMLLMVRYGRRALETVRPSATAPPPGPASPPPLAPPAAAAPSTEARRRRVRLVDESPPSRVRVVREEDRERRE